jgi:DNA-binding transcriptional ArsR family regulator
MKEGPNIARIAALLGDRARADALTALMRDQALTATELAAIAGVTKQTMSAHLSKLLDAGLVEVDRQGRHRYFRLGNEDVARLLESLMGVAFRTGASRLISSPRDPALQRARSCYDHLAGEMGVLVYEALLRDGVLENPQAPRLTEKGIHWFAGIGVDTAALAQQHRSLCRPCMDWSARRHHLAGSLGTAMLSRFCNLGWVSRSNKSRAIRITQLGERKFQAILAVRAEGRPHYGEDFGGEPVGKTK